MLVLFVQNTGQYALYALLLTLFSKYTHILSVNHIILLYVKHTVRYRMHQEYCHF